MTKPQPRPILLPDFDGSPFRIGFVCRVGYVVVEGDTLAVRAEFDGDPVGYQAAYELCASLNVEAAAEIADSAADLAAERATEAGASVWNAETRMFDCFLDGERIGEAETPEDAEIKIFWAAYDRSRADRDPGYATWETEMDAREQALAARCDCFALGIEQDACLKAGACQGERDAWAAASAMDPRARAEEVVAWAAEFCQAAPVVVPEPTPLHPAPWMSSELYAAMWDARSESLALVARTLAPDDDPTPPPAPLAVGVPQVLVATAHVSLTERLELRRGPLGLVAVQIREDRQGYTSEARWGFADEAQGRDWIAQEASRLRSFTRAA